MSKVKFELKDKLSNPILIKLFHKDRIKNDVGEPCVSYVAITMTDNLDLNVYTHRGHPSKIETIKSNSKLKKERRELKHMKNS